MEAMHWKTLLALLFFLAIYTSIFAAVFHEIESHAENRRLGQLKKYVTKTLRKYRNNMTKQQLYEIMTYSAKNEFYVQELLQKNVHFHNRTFSESFHFAMTTLATIGFGMFAPVTDEARIILVVFTIFGIPLMMVLIDGIGQNLVHFVLKTTGSFSCYNNVSSWVIIGTLFVIAFLIFFIVPAYVISQGQAWSYGESLYYCYISLSTVGFGNKITGLMSFSSEVLHVLYHLFIDIWLLVGLSFLTSIYKYTGNILREQITRPDPTQSTMPTRRDAIHDALFPSNNLKYNVTVSISKHQISDTTITDFPKENSDSELLQTQRKSKIESLTDFYKIIGLKPPTHSLTTRALQGALFSPRWSRKSTKDVISSRQTPACQTPLARSPIINSPDISASSYES